MPVFLIGLGIGAALGGGGIWFASDKVGSALKWGAIAGGLYLGYKYRNRLTGAFK